MKRKIIRIGKGFGVTIPKKELEKYGLKVGDEVEVTIEPVNKLKNEKFRAVLDELMDTYDQDFKNLADR